MHSLLVVFLSLSSVGANAAAQEDAVKLTIKVPERNYHTIEVIPLAIEMTNTGKASIKLRASYNGGTGGLKLYFQIAEWSSYKGALNLQGAHSRESFERDLKPGETLRYSRFMSPSTVPSTVGVGVFETPPPGLMKLKASYDDSVRGGVTTVQSDPVTVDLKSSQSLPDPVRTLFGEKPWHRFVLNDGLGSPEDSKAFRAFYASGNSVPQRDVLAFMVGRSYEREFIVSPAAVLAYKEARKTQFSYLKAKTLLHLADCYSNLEKGDEKSKALREIPTLDCDSWVLKEYKKRTRRR